MDVTSLGYRTDLALLELGGSTVEDCGDHLVVRTRSNPSYWWGNFLLLHEPPGPEDADRWLERFAAAFPDAQHRTFGVDGAHGGVEDLAPLAERGLEVEAATVMTATAVHEPPRPNRRATYRPLVSDDDWSRAVELELAVDDDYEPVSHREFLERRAATNRALVEAGHGQWFGAFVDGELVSQMGLVAASPGLARFQAVLTHPDHRGRGLAGTLVHHVSTYGFTELGATTLVMVADPTYLAIRVYRAVGFVDGERQLRAELPPEGAKT